VFALASLAATACVGDADKGDEDDIPTDGKEDSFVHPSDHGTLAFGIANKASFTDSEGFHMWTFELTGNAKVDLGTELDTQNLDTVMYLYKRTSSTSSWGAAIARNDDANDHTAASQLVKSLGKGQYRVLVKAYKRIQRGDFSVTGACTGSGCPAPGATCGPAVALPVDTDYGGSCGAKLGAIYEYGSVDATQSITVTTDDRCTAPALQRLAVDYYKAYWDDIDPDEFASDTELEVETQVLGGTGTNGGTLVSVTDGGDESSITFVFDHDDKLVALYQSNQSPDVHFYCRESTAAKIDLPNVEDCVGALVNELPHNGDDESDVGLTAAPGNLPVGLGTDVSGPMRRYSAQNGTAASTKLTVDGAQWDLFDGKAARIDVSATGKPKTSYLATSQLVVMETPASGAAKLVCE